MYFRQTFLFCVAVSILIAGTEGLLRLKSQSVVVDDIPYILVDGLRVFKPNVDTVVTGGAFVPIHVKTNSDGFASPEILPGPPPTNTIRVAVLGNSFTRGFEVDYDKKFTSIAEKLLNEKNPTANTRFEVMNFGIGGYSIVDQFFVYERYVKKYHPAFVTLVLFPRMDFSTTQPYGVDAQYIFDTPLKQLSGARLLAGDPLNSVVTTPPRHSWEITRFFKVIVVGVAERIQRVSWPHSNRFVAVQNSLSHMLTKIIGEPKEITNAAASPEDDRTYFDMSDQTHVETMRLTARLIQKLARQVKDDGSTFSIVLIPSYWQVDNKYTIQLPQSLNPDLPKTILNQTAAAQLPMLDLKNVCERAINTEGVQVFIRDTGHFTAAGHVLVGRSLASFIQQQMKQ